MVLISGWLVVLVALNAAESCKIVFLDVAGCASIPRAGMGARVNRKKLAIVIAEIGRFPTHVGGMTTLAISRKAGLKMIRVDGGLEILIVTGNAIRRSIAVVVTSVTKGAVVDSMPFGQREKVVVKAIGYPGKSICIMAL